MDTHTYRHTLTLYTGTRDDEAQQEAQILTFVMVVPHGEKLSTYFVSAWGENYTVDTSH